MDPDRLYLIFNVAVMPAWALLIFAPRWSGTQAVVHGIWIPLMLTVAYLWFLVAGGPAPEGGGFTTLEEVMILFTSPTAVLAGWIHYLVFDLFVGAWEVRDSIRHSIRPQLMVFPLLLTLFVGPLGLATYLVMRWVMTREVTLDER